MNTSIYKLLSQSLGFAEKQIEKTIELLDSGATIPFISRYRKEATGSLDEVQIGNIKEAYDKLCETEKRKKFIISTIEEQGKLSEELKQRIDSCWDITELEDIYLPYKPHRRTRAEIAREHGLEPLAKIIMAQKRKYKNECRPIRYSRNPRRTNSGRRSLRHYRRMGLRERTSQKYHSALFRAQCCRPCKSH